MKAIIEFNANDSDSVLDATFSVTISGMKVTDREALKELPDVVKDSYLKFLKIYTNREPDKDFIRLL